MNNLVALAPVFGTISHPVMCQSIVRASTPPPPLRHVGVWNLNLAWLGWGIWTGSVKSFQQHQSVISLNMEVLKVGSSLSHANGSEKKVKVINFGQCVESCSCWFCLKYWVGHLNKIFDMWGRGEGGREIWTKKSLKVQMPKGYTRGDVKAPNWLTHYIQMNL